ncbi:MAG: VIT domain-containing protein [Planctomycetota bacterium]
MNRKRLWITMLGMTLVAGLSATTMAQGLIVVDEPVVMPIPRPHPHPHPFLPLTIKKLGVTSEIVDAVAMTRIDQVFGNTSDRRIEGTYIFPLDDEISISKFSMFMNDKEVTGQVLDREEARRQYEAIVAKTRDPALLEYVGTRMYQARIFPIPPGGEARIKLEYAQTLAIDDGLVCYRFPLGTAKHVPSPIESVAVLVEVNSRMPIKSVFCPTHAAAVVRSSDSRASASFEARGLTPDHDFMLYYSLSEKEFGLSLLTYREPGQDGFFLARIAPKAEVDPDRVLPKDICFVMDISGSMAGQKLAQTQRALKFCLANLNPRDRFNVIAFSHEPWSLRKGVVPADKETIAEAQKAVERFQANGGTNINDALLAALKTESPPTEEQPYLIVLLTDGQPTIGVTDPQAILSNVRQANPKTSVRMFVFGVGTDVNTKLLDRLAEDNRGARDYVSETEDIEVRVSSFYRKVANPVLSGLQLSWGELSVHDVFPQQLPDLFSGGEVVVVGRYSGFGHQAIELVGSRYGRQHRFVYEPEFPSVATQHEFVPRLWAVRKIAFLQDQIRLHGENPELRQAIIQLAKEYGIITDYTAYLVLEEGQQVVRGGGVEHPMADQVRRDVRLKERAVAAPAAEAAVAGADANRVSLRNAKMGIDVSGAYTLDFDGDAGGGNSRISAPPPAIRRAANRTFYEIDGRWMDSTYVSGRETVKVRAYSEEYFELARRHPGVAKFMALGERVVFVLDEKAYEIIPAS